MPGNRRPTIIDVGREAGVSKSTVSLVLRNSASVRAETRSQVRAAMVRIGYVYNRSAATLRSANAGLIGLVINDLRNPFFAEFATSLQMALAERGYATVVGNTDEDAALQEQVVASMIEHGVAGLILCPAYGAVRGTFDVIARAGIPAMQMLRRVDERVKLFPFAAPDYLDGSREATAHLVASGARRIAFVGGISGQSVTEERRAGYIGVLAEAGSEPLLLDGRASRALGREIAMSLASDQPEVDAVLCFNDLVALGMLSGLLEQGRAIGRDVRIVGFDDIEDASQCFPSLTSVHCDIEGFGARAAAIMATWLEKGIAPPEATRTPVTLAIRQSSGLPPDRSSK